MLRIARRVLSSADPPRAEAALPPATLEADVPGWRFIDWLDHLASNRALLWAAMVSVVVHCVLLLLFGQIQIARIKSVVLRELVAVVDKPDDLERISEEEETLDIALPDEREMETVFSAAPTAVAAATAPDVELTSAIPLTETTAPELAVLEPEPIRGVELDKLLVNYGAVGDEIATVEGAVDRITHEIALHLETSDVLVIWLMDASISLVEEREAVATRLERIYREIDELGAVTEGSLKSAVTAFGQNSTSLVTPTADGDQVVAAIRNVPTDESGIENVFSAIASTVEQYKPLRTREKRKMMVIVWTDESGDDMLRLEDAIAVCRRMAAPVFAVGPSAMFGREEGTQEYRDPEDGMVYELPVDRGPDTARPELLRLPYWFDGPQMQNLRAGVGPYALTRLSAETGGAYFINESKSDRSRFRLADLRPYLPAYTSPNEYTKEVKQSRLRQAILAAVDITFQRELKGTPRLSFAPTGDNFQQQLREAQESVAYDLLTIERALAVFGAKGMDDEYEQETSPRWRAWYDLTLGRLLALQVRCLEYNWACAIMKGKGADFVNQQSNRWEFVPDAKTNFGSASERAASEALRLLQRAVENNPGTPWAVLAERELANPLGFRVEESYIPPPEPQMRAPGNNNNPPPPGRRVEQPRTLPRKTPDQLPKL